jgi:hypothetical protein
MGRVVNATPRTFNPREGDPVTSVQGAGRAPGPVWTGAEIFAPAGIQSPDPSARSETLYRLRLPAHFFRYTLCLSTRLLR